MTYKKLGKSLLQVSEIAFGCMSLKAGQNDIAYLIDEAIDKGINFFDTADLYDKGLNEENVGKALKAKRDKILIATKVGNEWRPDGSGWDWNPSKKYILKAVDESLQRLQTDYIDLYQLHGGTIQDPIDEIIEAFEILQAMGKIRYYGISSIRPNVIKKYVDRSNIVSVMMQYSLLDRRPEEICLPLLKQHNIGVLARGSLAGGLLIDKPAKHYLMYNQEEISVVQKAIKEMGEPKQVATKAAIEFVVNNNAITAAVVGIRTILQIKEAVAAIQLPKLNQHKINALIQELKLNYYEDHR